MEVLALEANVTPSRASALSGSLLAAGVAGSLAFLLEFVRVHPTFGTGVSLWLFFPLAVLALYGPFSACLTALIAVSLATVFDASTVSPFDGVLYLFTVVVTSLLVRQSQQMRIVDGVMISWLGIIPANLIYHLELFRYGLNAGFIELSADLMSQLVPAMLVQWLAMRPYPLAPLLPGLKPAMVPRPMRLAQVVRIFRLPPMLLLFLACLDFGATQSLYERVALEQDVAIGRARLTQVLMGNFLQETRAASPQELEQGFEKVVGVQLAELSASSAAGQLQGSIDTAMVPSFEITPHGIENTSSLAPDITITSSSGHGQRSPIDWVAHREWLMQVPFDANGLSGVVVVREPMGSSVPIDYVSMMWGLLATFILLTLLLLVYRHWVRQGGASITASLDQFSAWRPGEAISLSAPFEPGTIHEADVVRDSLQSLLDKFNTNYRELHQVSSDRKQLLSQLRAIYAAMHEPVIVLDAEFNVRESLSNEAGIAWGRQLQSDMSEVYRSLQKKLDTTPEGGPKSDFSRVLFQAIHSDGSTEQTTVKLQNASGIEHSFYVSVGTIETGAVSTSDQESPAEEGLVILLSDVSALMATRRQLEQKSRLNALGGLATGIAHELNQPLNSIRLALANIRRRMEVNTLDETTLSEKVARLDEQVSRMGVLIKAMRAYSSEENDHPEPIDPDEVLDNILSLVNQEICAHDISISRESADRAVTLVANPNVLGRLYAEVLTNAIEALKDIEDKQRELDLVATTDGQYWVLEITDNAGGFEPAMADRLYEPFYTTKDDVKHAGLGLTTCWNIVEQLGGNISIRRQDDATKIRIALPIVGPPEETGYALTN